jgi:8-amino-3,8-dideoxy-alpha-D-manno-octulosonate transaminase
MSTTSEMKRLAIEGGPPAVSDPLPSMYPGGMKIGAEEEQAVLEVLRTRRLFRYYGPEPGPSRVSEFEQAFAEYMGASYCLAVSSGTGALLCGLAALGVGPGDEVIVPAYTFIATAEAVIGLGAVPIFAEVDESLTIDPADVEAKITRHTRAIIPVHMRGAPCDMERLKAIAGRHGVALLEDAAQANGGSYRGRKLGTIGGVGAYSLQFNKILTAGEGGVMVTDDEDLYKRALMYHDVHGGLRNNIPPSEVLPGINLRLSELQGAVALVQLRRLDGMLAEMRERKAALKAGIADIAQSKGIRFSEINDPEGDTAIALIFYLPDAERAGYVAKALNAEGVGASVMFSPEKSDYHIYYHWTAILDKRTWGAQGPWDWHEGEVRYSRDMCPRTLNLLGRAVHLDVSPELTDRNVQEIGEALDKVLNSI